MEKFLIFIIIFSNLKIITSQNDNIYNNAKMFGVYLDDINDPYFNDICLNLNLIEKDVTLEYRRKYYYYPKKSGENYKFQNPLRNYSYECFYKNISVNNIFGNITLLLLIIFSVVILLLIVILYKETDSLKNTPYTKLQLTNNKDKNIINNNKNKDNKNTDSKNPYTIFTPEKKEKDENDSTTPIKNIMENTNTKTSTNSNINNESIRPIFETGNELIQEQENNNYAAQESAATFVKGSSNEEIQENKKQNNTEDIDIPKEKSKDNYTFGFNFGGKYNIINNINNENEEQKEENINKKESKMKMVQQIYEEINPTKKKIKEKFNNNNQNELNNDTIDIFSAPESEKKVYVREEYFYFKYLLARIEDKRNMIQIYFDLLEQCQIFFKIFYVPFNIYEDRKVQIVYYLTKIYLYFLVNCLLINNSVINDIYDDKNNLFSDIIRSLKALIIIYFICFFLYKLTNIKKILIKRRYKLINMKIQNKILNGKVVELTEILCVKFFQNKMKTLWVLIILIASYSYYISFSFCTVFPNSQLILLKSLFICVIISLVSPFIFCWIPAYIRKKSLDSKNQKLYEIAKLVEKFFIA